MSQSKDDVVTCDEAREILQRFNASHWGERVKGERARYSIPANPDRDDDIRLARFIDQAECWQVGAEMVLPEAVASAAALQAENAKLRAACAAGKVKP